MNCDGDTKLFPRIFRGLDHHAVANKEWLGEEGENIDHCCREKMAQCDVAFASNV